MTTATLPEARTYGGAAKPKTPGFGPFGRYLTGALFAAALIGVLVLTVVGPLAGIITLVALALVLVGVGIPDKHGQSALAKAATRAGFRNAQRTGANLYRSGPFTDLGTYQLPGMLASSELIEAYDATGEPFAVIRYATTRHYVVVMAADPDGAGLYDGDVIDQQVAAFGQEWLAPLAAVEHLVQSMIVVQTEPDLGDKLAAEVEGQIAESAPELAKRIMREVTDSYPTGSAEVRTWVALTFRTPAADWDAEPGIIIDGIAEQLPGIMENLAGTGAGPVRLLDGQDLCDIGISAFDPEQSKALSAAAASGRRMTTRWADVGPSATQNMWDHYRHDSGTSRSWLMTSPPRGATRHTVLRRLLQPNKHCPVKRVTFIYNHISPGRAGKLVDDAAEAATFRANSNRRGRPTSRQAAEVVRAKRVADEEAGGAGLVDIAIVVTITVPTPEDLPRAVAAMDHLVPTARAEMRPAYGANDAAFALGLPFGLVALVHSSVPTAIREGL